MYKKNQYKVLENRQIAKDIYEMVLEGDTQYILKPGQFINIKLEEVYLRRPISICSYNSQTITIVYKVVGRGTTILSRTKTGTMLDVLTGLGNGFSISPQFKIPLLIGGGVGTPPMYQLAKELIKKNCKPTIILGFSSKEDVFYEEKFKKLGVKVLITTVDGSYGIKGFVTDAIQTINEYDYFYACGPHAMLQAVSNHTGVSGQLSFEERMGCGFGGCMGCSCKTLTGYKRICVEGPVLDKGEIIW